MKDICIDMKDVLKSLPSGEMSVHWSEGRISSATQRVSDRSQKEKKQNTREKVKACKKEKKIREKINESEIAVQPKGKEINKNESQVSQRT